MEDKKKELITLLKENEVIKFGKFTLSSGKESDYYVDMKRAVTDPEILSKVAEIISEKIEGLGVDKVAGPALGAVPIATAISLTAKLPLLMIRKEKKGYGTSKLIEGDLGDGDSVVLVEDVTTTGKSLLKAIDAVETNKGVVKRAFVVVDRSEGALENFKNKGIELEPLLSIEDFNK